jgi:uncharacterized Zn finger protein
MEAALKLAQIVKDRSSATRELHEAMYNYDRKAMDVARQNLHAAVNGSNQEEFDAALQLFDIARQNLHAAVNGSNQEEFDAALQLFDIARQNLHAAVNGSNQEEFDAALQLFKIHNDAFIKSAEKLFAARKAEQDYLVTVHQITNSLIPTDDSEENA